MVMRGCLPPVYTSREQAAAEERRRRQLAPAADLRWVPGESREALRPRLDIDRGRQTGFVGSDSFGSASCRCAWLAKAEISTTAGRAGRLGRPCVRCRFGRLP